jgi:nucleoside 2-deoxyribosyltransferase
VKVYFAAPLFSQAEREFNERLCEMLEAAGHSVFLPQRDGFESRDDLRAQTGIDSDDDVRREIFRIDSAAVRDAGVVVAVLDGQVPDEGVAVEIGIAHETDRPILGIKTDRRNPELNAMVFGPLERLVDSPEKLVESVNDLSV